MTEKRYFVSGYSVWDSYNDNRRIDTRSKPICDLLNRLNEENEQLKQQLETANDDKKYVKQVIKDRIKHFHSYSCIDSTPQDHKGCWGLKMELEKFYDDVEPYL